MAFQLPALRRLKGEGAATSVAATAGGTKPTTAAAKQQYYYHAGRVFTPLPWNEFYDSRTQLHLSDGDVTIYQKGQGPTLLLMLHGGGHSALSWAVFAREICHRVDCRAVAFDQRGHGSSTLADESDLSLDKLCTDAAAVANQLVDDSITSVVILGHSMGGAVAAHVAVRKLIPTLRGLVVVDVVEGTALEALSGMEAIQWSIRSGQLHNVESARVSMPAQLKKMSISQLSALQASTADKSVIHEEEEEDDDGGAREGTQTGKSFGPEEVYVWRVDLEKTKIYWQGWFEGLSKAFLSTPVAKMLLLAGVDRLDRDLTIGQMQGKFQLTVLGNVGHSVQEDSPEQAADAVATYLLRMKLAEPKQEAQ